MPRKIEGMTEADWVLRKREYYKRYNASERGQARTKRFLDVRKLVRELWAAAREQPNPTERLKEAVDVFDSR